MIAELRSLALRVTGLERSLQRPTQEIRDNGDLRLRWGRHPDGSWTYRAIDAGGNDAGDLTQADIPGRLAWSALPGEPDGWLIANGQQVTGAHPVLRSKLVAAGNPYGSGGGNPLLPNLVGSFARGSGSGGPSLGATGGAATVTLTAAQMPSHTHTGPSHTHPVTGSTNATGAHGHSTTNGQGFATHISGTSNTQGGSGSPTVTGVSASTDTQGNHSHTVTGTASAAGTGATGSAGSGAAHENLPPFVALTPLVRAY